MVISSSDASLVPRKSLLEEEMQMVVWFLKTMEGLEGHSLGPGFRTEWKQKIEALVS